MFRLSLNSEAKKTKGAVKPCHTPSQKPAMAPCEFGLSMDWFAPGTHPASMRLNNNKNTSGIEKGFMARPPLLMVTKHCQEKSRGRAALSVPTPGKSANRQGSFRFSASEGKSGLPH